MYCGTAANVPVYLLSDNNLIGRKVLPKPYHKKPLRREITMNHSGTYTIYASMLESNGVQVLSIWQKKTTCMKVRLIQESKYKNSRSHAFDPTTSS